MAKKPQTIIYDEWASMFAKMSDGEAGKIIKAFFIWVNDRTYEPGFNDRVLELVWGIITDARIKDEQKYFETCERNSRNARQKKQTATQATEQAAAKISNAEIPNDIEWGRLQGVINDRTSFEVGQSVQLATVRNNSIAKMRYKVLVPGDWNTIQVQQSLDVCGSYKATRLKAITLTNEMHNAITELSWNQWQDIVSSYEVV